jgi:hypothetical protein
MIAHYHLGLPWDEPPVRWPKAGCTALSSHRPGCQSFYTWFPWYMYNKGNFQSNCLLPKSINNDIATLLLSFCWNGHCWPGQTCSLDVWHKMYAYWTAISQPFYTLTKCTRTESQFVKSAWSVVLSLDHLCHTPASQIKSQFSGIEWNNKLSFTRVTLLAQLPKPGATT